MFRLQGAVRVLDVKKQYFDTQRKLRRIAADVAIIGYGLTENGCLGSRNKRSGMFIFMLISFAINYSCLEDGTVGNGEQERWNNIETTIDLGEHATYER